MGSEFWCFDSFPFYTEDSCLCLGRGKCTFRYESLITEAVWVILKFTAHFNTPSQSEIICCMIVLFPLKHVSLNSSHHFMNKLLFGDIFAI